MPPAAALPFRSTSERPPETRWVKKWVPQQLILTGSECLLLKWVKEDTVKALEEKETEPEETKPEPTTEVLFLCSYEGCGRTFSDTVALKKHAHIHGEKQHVCQYEGCGMKFLDRSKLKRHQLRHTGVRDFVCPHEGCGKAFSLDFNLKAHMRTHLQDNYHNCPYPECGKIYTQEYKLKTHIKTHHEKNISVDVVKHTQVADKRHNAPKAPVVAYGSGSSTRPYACPYEGCGKDYIHEYKLNLHLRKEHPGHYAEENRKHTPPTDHFRDGSNDRDDYVQRSGGKNLKRSQLSLTQEMPPVKVRKGSSLAPTDISITRKQRTVTETYEDDSEQSENGEDTEEYLWKYGENTEECRWKYREENEDDEETEDED